MVLYSNGVEIRSRCRQTSGADQVIETSVTFLICQKA